ncbi:S8 family peptidase [Bacillus massiliigorillae]|uniref:S8 family peptidase n=1 Tax=Bacillus massiliigorillae TaxID=1243664 RepID=UPI00039E7B57|nr:S8 family serine peptidase [Bacillus massiliigorillae]
MKKSLKTVAAFGLSSLLLASAAMPSATLAKAKTLPVLDNFKSISYLQSQQLQQDQQKSPFSEDTFIIRYNKPLTATEHRAAGGTLVRQIADLNYAVVKVKSKNDLAKVMKVYQKLEKVTSVSPSVLYKLQSLGDPKANQQYQLSMLQVDKAQQLAGKNKVTVAVIDMGTDPNHPDLKDNLLPGINIANPGNQPFAADHGTHVSGIIGAVKGNGIGGYGINPNVKILPIDVLDGNGYYLSDYVLADGILTAVAKGAKVINMSLGMPYNSPVTEAAVQKAIKAGVVVVAAAGNDAADYVNYPAGYEGVISVGSINKEKKLSEFSSFGPSVDIVAPGEAVYSTLYEPYKKSTYAEGSGTSMASPVIAGAASLLLSKYPNLTPAQVEYILEQTADDLGEPGYDTKYAHGLVNIVKALSYDVSKLPAYVKEDWTKQEILAKAEKVDVSNPVVKEDSITKPFEQKWLQFEVKKGEYIQTSLLGAKQYDYKIMTHFYGANGKVQSLDINDSQDGSSEGKLLQAPFDGTMVIGVKDVNANFDDSGNKASSYKLSVTAAKELPKDESTIEQMIAIPSLPYNTAKSYTLAVKNGDFDYFTLKVKEEQMIRVNLSEIPGLNTDISVYNLNNIIPEDATGENGEPLSPQAKLDMLKVYLEGEESGGPEFYANNGKIGQGELLTFTAQADQEYIIKIGANAYDYNTFYFGPSMATTEILASEGNNSSLLPYSLKVDSKVLPEDEDGINEETLYGESAENEKSGEAVATSQRLWQKQRSAVKAASDPYFEEQNRIMKTLLDGAQSYGIGDRAKGYLQNNTDIDVFLINPEETAIYEFGINNREKKTPYVSISEVVEEKNDDGEVLTYLNGISENMVWGWYNADMKDKFYTGLQKGKKYLVTISGNYYSEDGNAISFEPYELTSKLAVANPEDEYEPNNEKDDIAKLSSSSIKANLAMPNDIDRYYYAANETGIKGISVEVDPVTNALRNQYPSELIQPYHGYATIIEDSNGNGKLDEGDQEIQVIERGLQNFTSGSFKTVQNKGYFIVVGGYSLDYTSSFSLLPYTLKLESLNKKDEVSSQAKPMKMKQASGTLQTATGYLNAGVTGGDVDWYEFDLKKNAAVTVKLEAGKEADSVISLYSNGKLIKESDSYHQGDLEEFQMNLQAGKYQVKVSDANGAASITPYTLKVYAP